MSLLSGLFRAQRCSGRDAKAKRPQRASSIQNNHVRSIAATVE